MALPTGIETLDRKLGGGVPPGTLVAVTVPPGIQHDPLLCAGADERASHFFSTVKSVAAVRKMFERSLGQSDLEHIEEVDVTEAATQLQTGIDDLGDDEDFYIDVIDPIEETLDRAAYVDLLNHLTERLDTEGTVGYLYGFEMDGLAHNRRYTLDIADMVLKLRAVQQRKQTDFYLEIPKANGVVLTEKDRYLEIDVAGGIDIDQTRNI